MTRPPLLQYRYDDTVSAQDNMDLQTTILSRFDMIFIVRDETSREKDERLATHLFNIHQAGHPTNQQDDVHEEVQPSHVSHSL